MQGPSTAEQGCWRCRETAGGLVCAGCGAVQALRPDADLFAVLGLPRALQVDAADLERRYHAASRAVHPDRYQTASERDQQLSLAASAAVNRAYRTLRDPVSRGRYWLELHGMRLGEGRPDVPPVLAADVFETQELLEEFRAAGSGAEATKLRGDVERVRDRFAARLAGLGSDLIDGFARSAGDGAADLERLRGRLAEIAYLRTLVGDIEETLGEGLRGTNHRH